MRRIFLITSLICLPLYSTAAAYNLNAPMSHESGKLAAYMIVTTHGQELRRKWISNYPLGSFLNKNFELNLSLGEKFETYMLFEGCAADRAGFCNLQVKYALRLPSGQTKQLGSADLWNALPPRDGNIQLSHLTFEYQPTVPGEYTIQAQVHDRVSGQFFDVARIISVK